MAELHIRKPMNKREIKRFENFAKNHDLPSADELEVNENNTLLAFSGNKLVGGINFTHEKKFQDIIIDAIGTHPNYKQKGIGKKLIQALEEYAITKNVKTLSIISQKDNHTAEEFHRSVGFRSIGESGYMEKDIKPTPHHSKKRSR